MTYLLDIWGNLVSIVQTMTLGDYFEIVIIAFFVYYLLKFVKETRAEQLLKGIAIVVVVLLLVRQLRDFNSFRTLALLSDTFFNVGAMAVIVMFQPELRRVLEKMGRAKIGKDIVLLDNPDDPANRTAFAIEQIVTACEKLSRSATGALIVFERRVKLGEQIDTGTLVMARPSVELIGNIFFHNTPLHDGALIVRDGILFAAGCFLPKPSKEELISKELGSRHRAAIGMSEVSDAIIVIVSEETGMISIAENGAVTRGFDKNKLSDFLTGALLQNNTASAKQTKQEKQEFKQKKAREKANQKSKGVSK